MVVALAVLHTSTQHNEKFYIVDNYWRRYYSTIRLTQYVDISTCKLNARNEGKNVGSCMQPPMLAQTVRALMGIE